MVELFNQLNHRRKRLLSAVLASVVLLTALPVDASVAPAETKLTSQFHLNGGQGGFSVATSGEWVAFGAYLEDEVTWNTGAVFVSQRDGDSWGAPQRIVPAVQSYSMLFGFDVALDGNRLVASAHQEDAGGYDRGAAYVFEWDGTSWVEIQRLTASDGANADGFGVSVAIDDDRIIVGAHQDDDGTTNGGSAYVFDWNGTAWLETQKLTDPVPQYYGQFGRSVAVDGDRVAVGSDRADSGTSDDGAAVVFDFIEGAWVATQRVVALDGASGDNFGQSVDLAGDTLLVGAPRDDIGVCCDHGSAYVFSWNGTEWQQVQKLLGHGVSGSQFGVDVALHGERALIGAPNDHSTSPNTGRAHLFERANGAWELSSTITASDAFGQDDYGRGVALSEHTLVIGAPLDDDVGNDDGAAYVYGLDADNDDVVGWIDNCPDIANADQSDTDEDGTGDACDDDLDGDGIVNGEDNCPATPNANQEDLDGDDVGDPCDDDRDGDGVSNADEAVAGTNPDDADTDGDGLDDGAERAAGTNPHDTDSDNDGFTDGEEVDGGSDPLNPYSIPTPLGPATALPLPL